MQKFVHGNQWRKSVGGQRWTLPLKVLMGRQQCMSAQVQTSEGNV